MMMRTLGLVALTALAAACGQSQREPAPVVYRGTAPSGAVSQPAPAPQPVAPATDYAASGYASGDEDARGIIRYDGYETIRARRGDTVEAMAARAGIPAADLAAYNGLSTQYVPSAGDELVLPARTDRYDNRVVAEAPRQTYSGGAYAAAPSSSSAIPSGYEPSVAAPAGSTGSTAGSSGWSADLARAAIDQPEPAVADPVPQPAPQPAPSPSPIQQTTIAPTAAPQPAPAPAPAAPAPAAAPAAEQPRVAFNTAPAASASGGQFQRPTAAPIARPFSRAPGPDRNDGVDFATAAGDPVVAAGNGTVALISKSLGGLGTIVLIRHDNQFLTVYGRLDEVSVTKGDQVQRGQVIAKVADLQPPKSPHLHFEVRKGAESVDPTEYF